MNVFGGRLYYSDAVSGVHDSMYVRSYYGFIMAIVAQTYGELFGGRPRVDGRIPAAFRSLVSRRTAPPLAQTAALAGHFQAQRFWTSFNGIVCADGVNPDRMRAWIAAGNGADRRGPWFGRYWTWQNAPCGAWAGTGDDAFRGPSRLATSTPLLLLTTRHDPATPVLGAQAAHELYAGSRLLTLDSWGHGVLGRGGGCIGGRVAAYLIDQALPTSDVVCQARQPLFPGH